MGGGPVKAWGATDRGLARSGNEDAYFILPMGPDRLACGVADGLGGFQAGEVAAALAIEVAQERIRQAWQGPENDSRAGACLRTAIWEAHRRIRESGETEGWGPMASTLTLVALWPGEAALGHVGDSRAYLYRDGELRQLTRDQSPVGEMLWKGEITEAEARSHPGRHLLDQAVGTGELEYVEEQSLTLQQGDLILLCTDGLTAVVDPAEIASVLSRHQPGQAPQRLIALANRRGGPDNVTVVVAEVGWEDTR